VHSFANETGEPVRLLNFMAPAGELPDLAANKLADLA